MTYGKFIGYITRKMRFAAISRFLVPLGLLDGRRDVGKTSPHYIPLNGRSLKDIALKKLHHGNSRFLNPVGVSLSGRFREVMRWKFSRNAFETVMDQQTIRPIRINWLPVHNHPGLSITFLKHAGLIIKEGNETYYIDPVFDGIGFFYKDYTPRRFSLSQIPRADHILITHGHYDHLDTNSLRYFEPGTHVISPLGYDDVFGDLGMKNRNQLDWYDTYESGKQRVTFLPSNHWTMRNPLGGPNRSLWGSYLFETRSGYTLYVSGDTAYFDGFEQIGGQFDIDLAIFNLGAYEPRWFMAPSHTNPMETVRAFRELRAKYLMIVHWGTFQLGDEPVYFPPRDLKIALQKEGLLDRLVDIRHGETFFVD